jgi:hypothetical protein
MYPTTMQVVPNTNTRNKTEMTKTAGKDYLIVTTLQPDDNALPLLRQKLLLPED